MGEAAETGESGATFDEYVPPKRENTQEIPLPRPTREVRETDNVLAEICHDMRTPLSAILGFSELMKTQAFGPLGAACYDTYCGQIYSAASFLLDLVNDIMDYAKAGSGADSLELEEVDVAELVGETIALMQVQATVAQLNLSASISSDLGVVRTDKTKLRQILLNLIANAVKFTRPGGRISVNVALAHECNAMTLRIRDNGIGIAAADLAMAMRPFGQIRAAQKNTPKGSGLGLPLTKRYAELLGGVLEIRSGPGVGTTAVVRLPIDSASATNAPAIVDPRAARIDSSISSFPTLITAAALESGLRRRDDPR